MREIVRQTDGLARAIDVPRGLTALVGGGGKTTLMLRLARELAAAGNRVVVSTSTHIWPPDDVRTLLDPTEDEVRAALAESSPLCVGIREPNGKLVACRVPWDTLTTLADYVLTEADGAKGMPLKAPAAHEPVIPACARLVIAVSGMDGAEGTIAEQAFRPERYAALLGTDMLHTVLPEDIAHVLADENGQHKGVPAGARFYVALNKAGTPTRVACARAVGERLDALGVAYAIVA